MDLKKCVFSKRSQVTIFIIVGIAVLVFVGLFFMFRNLQEGGVQDTESQLNLISENVGVEFTPVQGYVDSCIATVGKEAVKKLGYQGGYIDPEVLAANSISPTEGNANSLTFFPGDSSYKVAYWWYMDSPNDCDEQGSCSFASNRPEITGSSPLSIERQIETYVDDNIEECIDNFASFRERGFSFENIGEPKTDVTIASRDVVLQLEYPLTVSKDNRQQDMENFFTKLDVNLRGVYEFASVLAKGQGDTKYLERQALNLITVFSGIEDDESLPPMSEMSLFSGEDSRFWTRTEVKTMLKTLLTNYVPFVQVIESRNFQPVEVESEMADAIFKMMVVSLGEPYFNYSVNFDYRGWWDPYLKIGNSEMLKPSGLMPNNEMPLLGAVTSRFNIRKYTFAYDFSYPVIAKIFDHSAFNGEGYTFNIALESNLRNNFPVNSTSSEFLESDSVLTSMFCNLNQRKSGNITFHIRDSEGDNVEDVGVSYECGGQSCFLGNSKEEPFKTEMPLCVGGRAVFNKPGYVPYYLNMSVGEGDSYEIDIDMERYRTKKAEVKVYRYRKVGGSWSIDPTPTELGPTEVAVLSFDRHSEANLEEGAGNFVVAVEGDDEEAPEIKIVPGRYDVEGSLIYQLPSPEYDKIVIPKKKVKECAFLGMGCTEYTLDKIPFKTGFPEGGVYLDDDNGGAWQLSESYLDSGDTITFYVIASPGGNFDNLKHRDLEEMAKIEYYSSEERFLLEPEVS